MQNLRNALKMILRNLNLEPIQNTTKQNVEHSFGGYYRLFLCNKIVISKKT